MGRLEREGKAAGVAITLKTKAGVEAAAVEHVFTIHGPDGRVLGYEGLLSASAKEDEVCPEMCKRLAENMLDLVCQIDPRGKIEYISHSVRFVLGHNAPELAGRDVYDFIHPEDRERAETDFQKYYLTGTADNLKYRVLHANGEYRWLEARAKPIFDREFSQNWKDAFAQAGIEYFFTLIDDAVARIMKTEGGMLWALKNYDGDVMSDMIASASGSLAMMTSVLVSPYGWFEYEAAHGTVQKHYYKHLKGEETSSNSMALIFAWTGGLRKRGELDGTPAVVQFANRVEEAALETIEGGVMTGDLLLLAEKRPANRKVNTEGFIEAIAQNLKKKIDG
jgi:PAS domain S-box-containing protein